MIICSLLDLNHALEVSLELWRKYNAVLVRFDQYFRSRPLAMPLFKLWFFGHKAVRFYSVSRDS